MDKTKLLFGAGYVFIFAILSTGVYFLWSSLSGVNAKIAVAEETSRPAEIRITLVNPADCPLCAGGARFVNYITEQNVRIDASESVTEATSQGAELIETYALTKLPALIVSGEYDKENVRDALAKLGGEVRNDRLVVETNFPVYFDLRDRTAVGLVTMTYVTDSSCETCYDPKTIRSILESNFGVTVAKEETVDAQSADGQRLINEYELTQVPTAILSVEAGAYMQLAAAWEDVGTIERGGVFVFRKNEVLNQATYRDLKTGELTAPVTNNK
jgi:hypothetical protein